MSVLSNRQRAAYLEFIGKYAGDDIIIAAMLRTTNNISDAKELDAFVTSYKPSVLPDSLRVVENGSRGGAQVSDPHPPEIDAPEDLGPVPKKLGANGKRIYDLMVEKRDHEWSVDGLKSKLGLPPATIKPMLALLLDRKLIKRVTNYTYQAV